MRCSFLLESALIDEAETKYLEAAQDLSDAQRNLKKQAFQSSKGAVDKFAKSGKGGKGGRKKNMKEVLANALTYDTLRSNLKNRKILAILFFKNEPFTMNHTAMPKLKP